VSGQQETDDSTAYTCGRPMEEMRSHEKTGS
jgi:hypothetical protein